MYSHMQWLISWSDWSIVIHVDFFFKERKLKYAILQYAGLVPQSSYTTIDDQPISRSSQCTPSKLICSVNPWSVSYWTQHGILVLPPPPFLRGSPSLETTSCAWDEDKSPSGNFPPYAVNLSFGCPLNISIESSCSLPSTTVKQKENPRLGHDLYLASGNVLIVGSITLPFAASLTSCCSSGESSGWCKSFDHSSVDEAIQYQ